MANAKYLALVATTLLSAPMAYAHLDGAPWGTPKLYCEDSPLAGDQATHDYGPPSPGFIIALGSDWSTPQGQYPLLGGGCAFAADVPNQWDGHMDFAVGGAWLLACESDCGDGTGDGSLVCFGTYADHPVFPSVFVTDNLLSPLGGDVDFSVYADTLDNVPDPSGEEPSCGDFESDFGVDCVNQCTIGFPVGLDGSYQVYVAGTSGHVSTLGGGNGGDWDIPWECSDGLDNDGDGRADHPQDSDCTSASDPSETCLPDQCPIPSGTGTRVRDGLEACVEAVEQPVDELATSCTALARHAPPLTGVVLIEYLGCEDCFEWQVALGWECAEWFSSWYTLEVRCDPAFASPMEDWLCENPHVTVGLGPSGNSFDSARGKLRCGAAFATCDAQVGSICNAPYWTSPSGEFPPLYCELDVFFAQEGDAWAECFNDP